MTRTVGRYVAPEMAALWVAELVLAFVVVYAMMAAPPAADVLGASWRALDLKLANHAALLACTLGGTAIAIGLYRPDICLDPRRVVLNAAVVAVLAFPVALAVGGAFSGGFTATYAVWLVKVLALWIVCLMLTRWVLRLVLRQAPFSRRVMVVGAGQPATRMAKVLRTRRGAMFELAGALDPAAMPPSLDDLRADRVWALLAAGAVDAEPAAWLLDYKLRGVQVFDELGFCERHLGRISLEHLSAAWLLGADGFSTGRAAAAVKRMIDVIVSLLLLALSLPLMVATAVAVHLETPGPILYRQERVGLLGGGFTLLKFRSMREDAEAGGMPRWAALRDQRATRVGAFIRSTRIDELPQLLNVLRGDMSLVGPRPERPHFVEHLAESIPFYNDRAYVKPGITGWAQVNYPYGASVEDAREKLAYDLYYVKNRGLFLDLLVLIATVRVILFREGAR
ncbi:MAG: exopolysaccharide biosynthesis polyprenyl glycosylphosphotransferase [Acetobacteraceae bacterium]